ncbi:MAG TPA: beta-ketoacyl-ACP synthase II [Thermoanaerobaculia bacterium]|nr:beta-ketoacyl-ACP synthase II [Thermoanaerobaculia bacterium]
MSNAPRTRVAVTGLGAISPLALSWPETWTALLGGKSGVGPISRFDASAFRSRIAGEVRGFAATDYVDAKTADRLERFELFALAAAREALRHANLPPGLVPPERMAVVVGSGVGGIGEIERQYERLRERGPRAISPIGIPKLLANSAAGQIAIETGAQGFSVCPVSACASGAHALALALDLLRAGRADVVVAGGSEAAITPLAIGGFCAMEALSLRNDAPEAASRPFDAGRDGFVMAEGSGIAVLETMEHAAGRGARPLAELRGAGSSTDAHHRTRPHPDGRGYAQAMTWALRDAGISPTDVQYVNAHATSTPVGDEIEALAVKGVFGSDRDDFLVSSTKSMTGHLLGASGALEFAVVVQALVDQVCPPTINLERPAKGCEGLDLVAGASRRAAVRNALSNSFGFGGHNVSLVVGAG